MKSDYILLLLALLGFIVYFTFTTDQERIVQRYRILAEIRANPFVPSYIYKTVQGPSECSTVVDNPAYKEWENIPAVSSFIQKCMGERYTTYSLCSIRASLDKMGNIPNKPSGKITLKQACTKDIGQNKVLHWLNRDWFTVSFIPKTNLY